MDTTVGSYDSSKRSSKRLTHSGVMDPSQLYEPRFSAVHHRGVDGAFDDRGAQQPVDAMNEIQRRAQKRGRTRLQKGRPGEKAAFLSLRADGWASSLRRDDIGKGACG